MSESLERLNEICFAPTRKGPRTGASGLDPLQVTVVRALTELDLGAVDLGRPLVAQRISSPQEMKHSHHQLARLIALGKEPQEISFLTGYAPSYISSLKGGKDFQELITYYATQREQLFVDTMERMKVAGISSLERLQALLDNEDEKWTKRELMEMAELMLIKPAMVARGGQNNGPPGPGVTVNVKFVAPAESGGVAPMIDITPTEQDREHD